MNTKESALLLELHLNSHKTRWFLLKELVFGWRSEFSRIIVGWQNIIVIEFSAIRWYFLSVKFTVRAHWIQERLSRDTTVGMLLHSLQCALNTWVKVHKSVCPCFSRQKTNQNSPAVGTKWFQCSSHCPYTVMCRERLYCLSKRHPGGVIFRLVVYVYLDQWADNQNECV